jgi:hypothetical protein
LNEADRRNWERACRKRLPFLYAEKPRTALTYFSVAIRHIQRHPHGKQSSKNILFYFPFEMSTSNPNPNVIRRCEKKKGVGVCHTSVAATRPHVTNTNTGGGGGKEGGRRFDRDDVLQTGVRHR